MVEAGLHLVADQYVQRCTADMAVGILIQIDRGGGDGAAANLEDGQVAIDDDVTYLDVGQRLHLLDARGGEDDVAGTRDRGAEHLVVLPAA